MDKNGSTVLWTRHIPTELGNTSYCDWTNFEVGKKYKICRKLVTDLIIRLVAEWEIRSISLVSITKMYRVDVKSPWHAYIDFYSTIYFFRIKVQPAYARENHTRNVLPIPILIHIIFMEGNSWNLFYFHILFKKNSTSCDQPCRKNWSFPPIGQTTTH